MKIVSALLTGILVLASGARAADQAARPTELTCAHTEIWSVGQETRGICTGAVTLIGTDLKITCDRLEFTALGVGDRNSTMPTLEKFKYMLATGHVVIVQGDREAVCGRAEVLPQADKVVLTENPSVVDRGTGWTNAGEQITLLHGERRVIVDKAHVVGPAIKDLGFDQAKPAAAPSAPPEPTVAPASQPAAAK